MDERVKRALAQWPDVPDVYGWLSLDARGRWRLRGETISNVKLIDFINRNYIALQTGGYAFQNGPQRVHVALEATPWIATIHETDGSAQLLDHRGESLPDPAAAWMDENGRLILETPAGPALLSESSLPQALMQIRSAQGAPIDEERLEAWFADPAAPPLGLEWQNGLIPLHHLAGCTLEAHFGFVSTPAAR